MRLPCSLPSLWSSVLKDHPIPIFLPLDYLTICSNAPIHVHRSLLLLLPIWCSFLSRGNKSSASEAWLVGVPEKHVCDLCVVTCGCDYSSVPDTSRCDLNSIRREATEGSAWDCEYSPAWTKRHIQAVPESGEGRVLLPTSTRGESGTVVLCNEV